MAALVVVGVVVYKRVFPSSDAGKARAEVQRWYDKRWPNLITVESCRYANPDSEYERFSCRVRVRCRERILFSVPRAAELFRSDDDPSPIEGNGAVRCATPTPRDR